MVIAIGKKSDAYIEPPPVAKTFRRNGDCPMNILPKNSIPGDILNDSVPALIAAAYFAVGKRLERKTQGSATRGFILSTINAQLTA